MLSLAVKKKVNMAQTRNVGCVHLEVLLPEAEPHFAARGLIRSRLDIACWKAELAVMCFVKI